MRFSRKRDGLPYADSANFAGGPAYGQSPRLELVCLVLATFFTDTFYESANETLDRLVRLLRSEDPKFAAKLALFARNECGMRSASHVIAAETAGRVKGESWVRGFLEKVVRRPDDAVEILAYYMREHGKPVPNAIKKGLKAAIEKFDGYQLAKYRCEGREISLVDLVNIVHPAPNAKNAEALSGLVNGTLKAFDTREVELSKAGQEAKGEAAKAEAKREAWKGLIAGGKLGLLALVKNLRNLVEQADLETVMAAAEMLRDRGAIQRSLVLPFRFIDAMYALRREPDGLRPKPARRRHKKAAAVKSCAVWIRETGEVIFDDERQQAGIGPEAVEEPPADTEPEIDQERVRREQAEKRRVLEGALSEAAQHALANVPKLEGRTVIMLDCSGSMQGRPYEIGATFAAALARTNGADIILFDTGAKHLDMAEKPEGIFGFVEAMMSQCTGGGTDFDCPFKLLEREGARYERIVIFSDMQAWVSDDACQREFKRYAKRVGGKPKLYSFDLAGYGTMQFPEESVYCMAGWSDRALELMGLLEEDADALARRIEAVPLEPGA